MTALFAPPKGATALLAPSRLDGFITTQSFDRPTLVIDTARVAAQYHVLAAGLGTARIHYAVKANPAREIIARLVDIGSAFDAASRGEINLCLQEGARPQDISFGNTIKRAQDIAWAYAEGIRLFAVDSHEELEKIAANAPAARVYIRLRITASQADWPLSRKFGCDHDMALDLLAKARKLGLQPVGFSFHVGSQTRQADMWGPVLDGIAQTWNAAKALGFELSLLNIGGGFPADYGQPIDAPTDYASKVMAQVRARFGDVTTVMAEPGRGLVAEAGVIVAEVVLVARKSRDDLHRWVYLNIGRFSGLAETEGEAIRYPFETLRDGGRLGPCIVAGPTCDSADVLYEKQMMALPMSLRAGDQVLIRNSGAYTSTYSSVWFNGFEPLDVVVI